MDKTTEGVLRFFAKLIRDEAEYLSGTENRKLFEIMSGDYSSFGGEDSASTMTAWEPIPEHKEGTCATCRHLDRNIACLTYPMQFRCEKDGELHFESDKCSVPAYVHMEVK